MLLPLGPLFEEWGAVIGTHPSLETEERAEVLCALLNGCKKIKNQVGYFRAVAGMAQACDSKFGRVIDLMPSSARAITKDPEVRRHMAISPQSFASSMRKKVQVILEQFRQSTARGRSYQAQALA